MDLEIMPCTKDSGVRLVSLQFRFPSPRALPPQLRQRVFVEKSSHRDSPPGKMVVEAVAQCSVSPLPVDLAKMGYNLVDAFYKERVDDEAGRYYVLATALYVQDSFAWTSEEFKTVKAALEAEIQLLADQSSWTVRIWQNEHTDHGVATGHSSMNLVCSHRTSLFNPDGSPVMVKVPPPAGQTRWERKPLSAREVIRVFAPAAQMALSA